MKCPKCNKEMRKGTITWVCKDCTVLLRTEEIEIIDISPNDAGDYRILQKERNVN